jgi:hypothetical protein
MLPIYNRLTGYFESPAGVPQTYTLDADPDPLSGTPDAGVKEYPDGLVFEDPQPNASLPKLAVRALLARVSVQRARGPCEWSELKGPDGPHLPYDARAGDVLGVQEYAAQVGPQRLVSVRYTPERCFGQVEEDLDPDRIIARAAAKARGLSGRRKHR